MTKMPIIFPFSGADIGGSHVATFALAQTLKANYGRDCIFLVAAGAPIATEAARLGFQVIDTGELEATAWNMRRRRNPLFMLRRLPSRLRLIRGLGPKCIIHCNDIVEIQSFGLIGKLCGLKILYHHHALNRMILPNRLLIRCADAVVAVSRICRRALSGFDEKKISVVLNPIEVGDVDRMAARSRIATKLGIDKEVPWVGFVGNFWRRKRPEFFLQAAAEMLRTQPRAHFILFGRRGDYEVDDLKQMIRDLGIDNQVTIAGFLMPAEDNIAAIDLLLAPAINEPFGRTPIEAILADVPYVATDDAGHAEIGARWGGGRMVPLDASPQDFAKAALEVLADPASVTLSGAAKDRVAADFAFATHAEAIEAIYRRLEG